MPGANARVVHEMLLEKSASQLAGSEAAAATATDVTATIKRAFWDSLQSRLKGLQDAGDHERLASDVCGLVREVQVDLLALVPGRSQASQAFRSNINQAVDVVCTSSHARTHALNITSAIYRRQRCSCVGKETQVAGRTEGSHHSARYRRQPSRKAYSAHMLASVHEHDFGARGTGSQ